MSEFEDFLNNWYINSDFNKNKNIKKGNVEIIKKHHESKFKSFNIDWIKISHEPIKTGYMRSDVNREVKVYVF